MASAKQGKQGGKQTAGAVREELEPLELPGDAAEVELPSAGPEIDAEQLRHARPEPVWASIRLPLAELPDASTPIHLPRHVDAHFLPEQSAMLWRLTQGLRGLPYDLDETGAEFSASSRLVDGPTKAIYWLLNSLIAAEKSAAIAGAAK
jgi:hypothetical protein